MKQLMQKVCTKRVFYFLCFIALNYIDYLHNTAPGRVWMTAVNCTGLVVMLIVFSVLPIREFLRPAYYVYSALCAAALPLVYLYWRRQEGELYLGQLETAVLNIWLLGLAVHYFWEQIFVKKRRKLRLNVRSVLWIAFTAWSVVSVAGRWWPIWFFLLFGVFYLTEFDPEDRTALLDGMINGTIVSFFLIQGSAYLFRPYDEVRYKGAYYNCNMMALYYLTVYCMVLFKLHVLYKNEAKWGWKLFYFAGAGALLSFQFMTMCRTAWAGAIAVTVLYGILIFRRCRGEGWGRILLRGCALVLCMAITFPMVFWTVRWLPTIHPHPIWHGGEWNEDRVHSWDPPDSPKYVDWDEFWGEMLGRFYRSAKAIDAGNPLVLRAHAKAAEREVYLDDYSWTDDSLSVRNMIFKLYLRYSTWFGNPVGREITFPEIGMYVWHAQNLWIQMTYWFGYPAGVLILLLTAAVLAAAYRGSRKIQEDPYAAIPFLLVVVYFLFGLMEIVWNPGQLIFTLALLVQHPQITGR